MKFRKKDTSYTDQISLRLDCVKICTINKISDLKQLKSITIVR